MCIRDRIGIAYKVKPYQINGPAWLNQQRFNIVARMPEGATADDTPAMLQALLKDRFKLVAHLTDQEHPVLALVAGKGGPKMKDASGPAVPLDLTAELKPNQTKMDMGDGPMIVTRNTDGSATMNMGVKGTFSQRMDMQAKAVYIDADHLNMDGFADLDVYKRQALAGLWKVYRRENWLQQRPPPRLHKRYSASDAARKLIA